MLKRRFSFLALMIAVMVTILAGAVQASIPAETSPADDLALHADASLSDDGWGGGSNKSDLTDGLRTYGYVEWYHGLAFQKGWNQVTIDFGTPVPFTTVTAWWHAGGEGSSYQPQAYRIESWNGVSWEEIFSTTNPSAYLKYPDATPADWWYWWSAPTENVFSPVTASKVRLWSYPKDGEVMAGYHVWLYEVEVYNIQVANKPPVADANGPYTGNAGSSITFNGSGSSDPDGTIVSYEWDLDGDGQYDDATGVQTQFTWNDDYSGNIGLKVTDNGGLTDTDTTTVTVKAIEATNVKFTPQAVNKNDRKGDPWVMVKGSLPAPYVVKDIDPSTVKLNGVVPAVTDPKYGFTQTAADGAVTFMFKFDRAAVEATLSLGDAVVVTITGKVSLVDFQGQDTIKVMESRH